MSFPFAALGRAFCEELIPHPDMLKFIPESYFDQKGRKMRVMLPKNAKVFGDGILFLMDPVITFRNVYCYSEVADIFKSEFNRNRVS